VEQFQVRGTPKARAGGNRHQAIVGVNASGNLEVLVERVLPDHECQVNVTTAVNGFRAITEIAPGSTPFAFQAGVKFVF